MSRTERLLLTCFLALSLPLLFAAPGFAQELEQLCPCDQLPATVFVAGLVDNYALPTDPTSRGAKLNSAFPNALWKNFDDSGSDQFVGHTFSNLPRDIVCAQLEIHLKPASFGGNDTLYLGLAPPPAPLGLFSWAIRLPELPGTGGLWQPPLDPGPFTLDLDDLPANSASPGKSILDQLNSDGRLDLLVQDDTVVDWVKLTLRTNPKTTLACGLADLFAGPTDPTFRGPELNGLAVPWKDLDDSRSNRHMGHTFANLPANIVAAELEIRLKPHRDVPENDSLNLGLTPPSSFSFSRSLATLTGTGWHDGDAAATVTLNLAALPGGVNLLSKINADHRLDVYVQDDSAVDYLRLRYRTCPPKLRVAGLAHAPIGDAVIAGNQAGQLVVSNLGGSAIPERGVRIDLGNVRTFITRQTLDTEGTNVGAQILSTAIGTLNGVSNQPIGTVGMLRRSDGFEVKVDYSVLGSTNYQARFFNLAGDLVYESVIRPDDDVSFAAAPVLELKCTTTTTTSGGTTTTSSSWSLEVNIPWDVVALFLRGGATESVSFEASRVEFRPVDPSPFHAVMSAVEVRATQMPELVLSEQIGIRAAGEISALGGVELVPQGSSLTATGFGSSGQAGFAIGEKGVKVFQAFLAPIDPEDTSEAGAFVHAEAFGELNGLADQSLGTLAVTKTDTATTPFEVSADFSAIASPTQHVQLLKNGQVVVDLPGNSGSAAFASRWPIRIGKLGGVTECYVQRFPPDTLFAIGGRAAEAVTGDELRILAESQTATVGLKSELQLRAAGIPELTLTDVATGTDAGCTPGPDRLCLRGGRFALEATFATPNGDRGQAQAVSLTDDTGYFWFFNSNNVEVVVKALNGCPVNHRFWVFSAGLTNVEVDLRVTDTVTGEVEHYLNPLATAYLPQLDTAAFATCSEPATGNLAETSDRASLPLKADPLLLNDDRFRVEVSWRTNQGTQGEGNPVELTSDTGYFWFFNAANVEVVVKVLNGCGVNGKYWVFAAGLTNVEVVMRVTDTATGAVKTYTNPLGRAFLPIQDTGAFSCGL